MGAHSNGVYGAPLISFVLLLCCGAPRPAACVTLQEALKQPDAYIKYDTSGFNPGVHAALAILVCLTALGSIWLIAQGFSRVLGRRGRSLASLSKPPVTQPQQSRYEDPMDSGGF